MHYPDKHAGETARLAALRRYNLLDTRAEPAFDRITNVLASIFDVPIALVSLIDAERQWFKSCIGLSVDETGLDVSFCKYLHDTHDPMIVHDATSDARFKDNDLVTGPPYIRFYAGAPLMSRDGYFLGSLCAIDTSPRDHISDDQIACLKSLAATVMDMVEVRFTNDALARANAELEEVNTRNELLNQAIEATEAGVTISDATQPDNPLIFVNQAFEDMTGYSASEAVGANCRFLQGPDTDPSQVDAIRKAISNRQSLSVEIYNYKQDGTPFWNAFHISPVFDDSGAVTSFIGIQYDITERKAREARIAELNDSLRENQEILQAIFNSANIGICLTGPDRCFQMVNDAYCSTYGYSRSELIGQPFTMLLPEDWQDYAADLHDRFLAGETEESAGEWQIIRKDGTLRHIYVTAARAELSRNMHYKITTVQDITERKQRARALAERESELRDIMRHVPASIGFLDTERRVRFFNQEFLKLHRLEDSDITGRRYDQLIPAERYSFLKPCLDQALSGEPVDFEMEIDRGADTQTYKVLYSPRFDAHGEVIGMIGVAHDVTELRKLTRQREEQAKLASLGQVAGGMAHEINNALQPLIGLTDVVRDQIAELDDEAYQYMGIIEENAEHARRIVDDVLTFARKDKVSLERYEAAHLVDAVCDFADDLIPSSIIVHKHNFGDEADDEPLGCPIHVSKNGMMQVFNNLFHNAAHAMAFKGVIHVSLSCVSYQSMHNYESDLEDGWYICIAIQDNGHGMDDETRRTIFDPFFTTKEHGEGTGLGMSVVYGMLRQWGGTIDIDSAPGEGTTIYLYIPVIEAKSNQKKGESYGADTGH